MGARYILLAAMLTLSATLTCGAWAAVDPLAACPEFPAPKKSKLQSVAERMEMHGMLMAIRRLESEEDTKTILTFYREKWAATEKIPAPVEYPLGPWQVIASQRGACFYTVQVKTFGKNGTEALLGVMAGPAPARIKEAVPMLPGSTVLNDLGHNDSGKTARTVLLRNGFSTATNADFYRRNLIDQGWNITNHYRMDNPQGYGDVVILRNGLRELSIAMTRDSNDARMSNIVLNYVDQP